MPLKKLRDKIDLIDNNLIKLLEQRLKLTNQTIRYKKKITDCIREKQILKKTDNPYIKSIYKKIFKNSKKSAKKQQNKK